MEVKLQIEVGSETLVFTHDFNDVEGFMPAVESFIRAEVDSDFWVAAGMAFGLAWGAFVNHITDDDNPLATTARSHNARCVVQVCDPDLEAAFGVYRQ